MFRNYKEAMKTAITTICCCQSGVADKAQASNYMVTNAIFPVIALVIIKLGSECELLMSGVQNYYY